MVSRLLYWIPRVFTILAIVFMMMFSLDSFGGNEPLGRKILGFLINCIPVFILIIILAIAWKREMIGGILFILAFIAGGIFFKSFSGNAASLIVIGPFFITGILFIIHHLFYRK
jgi:hypothetical protein